MPAQRSSSSRVFLFPLFRGAVALAVITSLAFAVHLNSAAAGFLFLMALVLNCLDASIGTAILLSLFAAGLLNYFFIEPLLTFRVADPTDVIALAAFTTTSILTTVLSSKAREQARIASQDRRNVQFLYDSAQRLLVIDSFHDGLLGLVEAIRVAFGVRAVCYFDAGSAAVFVSGDSQCGLPDKTRDAYIMRTDWNDVQAKASLRQLWVAGKIHGAIGFEGIEQPEIMAGPMAALASAVLERSQSCQAANRAECAARAEILRTAILDALAHEFKTPLATILTAAGGLRAIGSLADAQEDLAEMIESEAERLGELSSRLLKLARIESHDVRPRPESCDVESEVRNVVDRYAFEFPHKLIHFDNRGVPEEGVVDPGLFELALSQLLDNACKYSAPRSAIEVSLGSDANVFWIDISNEGSSILPSECRLIFERFFRGTSGGALAGSGLGLYVARKIAVAHGGSLDLMQQSSVQRVTFRLAFPFPGRAYGFAA